jgi:hypothetical protein
LCGEFDSFVEEVFEWCVELASGKLLEEAGEEESVLESFTYLFSASAVLQSLVEERKAEFAQLRVIWASFDGDFVAARLRC